MALGTTDIDVTEVKTALGLAQTQNFLRSLLCTDVNINKWSRYKPVRGTWPQSSNSKYALNLPTNWDYIAQNNDYRLDEFRGYEHDKDVAGPVIYNNQASCTATGTHLKPSDAPQTYTIIFNMNTAHESVRIIPSDLGINNYYWGVKLVLPSGGGTYYKTHSSVLGDGWNMGISVELSNPATPSFVNCPYAIGEFTWYSFVSSTSQSSWSTSAPSDIIYLP